MRSRGPTGPQRDDDVASADELRKAIVQVSASEDPLVIEEIEAGIQEWKNEERRYKEEEEREKQRQLALRDIEPDTDTPPDSSVAIDEDFIRTFDVEEAVHTGIYPSRFLSMVTDGPRIFGKIVNFIPADPGKNKTTKGRVGRSNLRFLNPYSPAHQEPLIIKQNRGDLVSVSHEKLLLLGPFNAVKDLLYIEGKPPPCFVDIVDVSRVNREMARDALIVRGGIPEENIRLHDKNFMAGPNSVFDEDYYEKEIVRGDPTSIHILSFGHGRFNEGMGAYIRGSEVIHARMRPQDTFGESVNIAQHDHTLIAEYNEAMDTEPDPDGTRDLWEKLGKRMLAGTVRRVLGCTNLDLGKIWRLTPEISNEDGYKVVRLYLWTGDHPQLKYEYLRGSTPNDLGKKIEFLQTLRPKGTLLRSINHRIGFVDIGNGMLRVVGQVTRPDLHPDMVFMQLRRAP